MRISDWSSDVCSSDLQPPLQSVGHIVHVIALAPQMLNLVNDQKLDAQASNEFVDAHTKHLFCPGTPVGVMHLEQDILEYRFERSLLVEPDNEDLIIIWRQSLLGPLVRENLLHAAEGGTFPGLRILGQPESP